MDLKDSSNSKQFPDLNADSAPRGAYPAGALLPPTSTGVFLSTAETGRDRLSTPGGSVLDLVVDFNLSHSWHGKKLKRGVPEWRGWESYYPARKTFGEAIQHSVAGGSLLPGHFQSNVRQEPFFVSQQIYYFDIEAPTVGDIRIADVLAIPYARLHVVGIWHTESSGKVTEKNPHGYTRLRVAVIVDEPVMGVERAKVISQAITAQLAPLPVDKNSFKPTQPAHGSTNHVEPYYINPGAAPVCIRELAQDLAPQAWEEMQRALTPAPELILIEGDEAAETAEQRYQDALFELKVAPDGDRANALWRCGAAVFGMAKGNYPGITEERAQSDLEGITTGWSNQHKVLNTIKRARKLANPRELKKRAPKKTASRQRMITPALPANDYRTYHYVGEEMTPAEMAKYSTLLINAPTGMGKTQAVAEYIRAQPEDTPFTGIAQFTQLTRSFAKAVGAAHYKDADGAYQRSLGQLPQLVSSVSSLPKFDRKGGICAVDEYEGVLKFACESNTLKRGAALDSYRAFKVSVQSADQFIGMDANLSSIGEQWLANVRGKPIVRRYSPPETRGAVTLLKDATTAVYQIGKLLKHGKGQVVATCTSAEMADKTAERYCAEYRVLKVTKDTSNTDAVNAASIDPEARAQYDLIVYDSSWGAGVNIHEPIYAQVCVFNRIPLAPEDALQLWGRVRHAKKRYAAVPADSDGYKTPPADQLLVDKLIRERWTAKSLGMNPQDSGDMLELSTLWAKFEERRQRETAQWRRYFIRRLQDNGYSVNVNNAVAPDAFAEEWKAWQQARKDEHWRFVLQAEEQALSDDSLDELRFKGQEITSDLKLRNKRFKIETAMQWHMLTEHDRDLMNDRHRERLYRLSDLMVDEVMLLDADRAQAEEGGPIHRRRYKTLDRRTLKKLFTLMGFTGTPEQQLIALTDYFREERSATDVDARFDALVSADGLRLVEALGHRDNNARTAPGLCRWVLDRFGLKLKSRQRRANGERPMFYQIDVEVLEYRLMRAHRAAKERLLLSKNVYSLSINTFLDTSAPIEESLIAAPHVLQDAEGWALEQERFDRQFTQALTAPVGRY